MDVLPPIEIRIPKENNDMARLREHAEWVRSRLADDTGAATAEYAIATMAAVGFAGLLVAIMRSDEVRGILTDLIRRALTVNG
jgi:Flp pilus assembly pilin Flp